MERIHPFYLNPTLRGGTPPAPCKSYCKKGWTLTIKSTIQVSFDHTHAWLWHLVPGTFSPHPFTTSQQQRPNTIFVWWLSSPSLFLLPFLLALEPITPPNTLFLSSAIISRFQGLDGNPWLPGNKPLRCTAGLTPISSLFLVLEGYPCPRILVLFFHLWTVVISRPLYLSATLLLPI